MSAHDGGFEPDEPRRKRRRRRRRRARTPAVDDPVVSIDLFIPLEELDGAPFARDADDPTPPTPKEDPTEAELQSIAEQLATRAQSLHIERVLLKAHVSRLREEFESVAQELEVGRQELERWQAALNGREAALVERERALERDLCD